MNLNDYNDAINYEWLETNGFGGWAGSSVIGCNTRRYHGLLVAAVVPPADRVSLVSKLEETIIINGERFELGVNDYNDLVHPNGHRYLVSFNRDLFPEFIYDTGPVVLKRSIGMVHGENTTIVTYEVLKAASEFQLQLLPLLSGRGYHSISRASSDLNNRSAFEDGVLSTSVYDKYPSIYINVPNSKFFKRPDWYYGFNYAVEKYRGQEYVEDLFSPGFFSVTLKQGDKLGIILSTENSSGRNAAELIRKERLRRERLLPAQPVNDLTKQLLLAADQFVVKRGENLKTIIAGYHWFTDWGRDTMISLPGLCLATGRFDDAKKILSAFAASVSKGMLPNRFQDNNEPPEYNNVDGTLWYFIAIHKYLESTGDTQFILDEILPVLKNIIDWHFKGTRYNIHVDDDGLLYSGEKGVQLTWMDAKVGDHVITPRAGYAVEVQALWYNALKIFADLLVMNNQHHDAELVTISADKVKHNFLSRFWFDRGRYLYDFIDENGRANTDLRPNQLFAISLPFQLVEDEKAALILDIVWNKLYIPFGLRSLSPDHPDYIGHYGGDVVKRDGAYHQGTAWSWLLGPFIDAIIKVKGSRSIAREIVDRFSIHLHQGCIGSVSEIFDGDAPYSPRGCVAQAWGVAELLRVIREYDLDMIMVFEPQRHEGTKEH